MLVAIERRFQKKHNICDVIREKVLCCGTNVFNLDQLFSLFCNSIFD